ncbi:MAG: S49 family peptidase [Rickettsiales bacterium]
MKLNNNTIKADINIDTNKEKINKKEDIQNNNIENSNNKIENIQNKSIKNINIQTNDNNKIENILSISNINNSDKKQNTNSNTNCKWNTKSCNNKWSLCKIFSCIKGLFIKKEPKVYILKLEGVIESSSNKNSTMSIAFLEEKLTKIFTSGEVIKALCIVINSPGGSPVQSELIANLILRMSKKYNVSLYSFIEDIGASGGYWLSCISDNIYASKSSIIGSIGVIYSGFGFKSAIEKLGIERRIYTSNEQKSFLDPFKDAKQEDISLIKELQNNIHNNFIEYVKSRRGTKLKNHSEIFTGRVWTGENAMELGLIDGINDVYSFIDTNFPEIKIEYIKLKESWIKKFFKIEESIILKEIKTMLENKFM